MTTSIIRTKVHQYIDEADKDVLEVIYQLLEVYRQKSSSVLTDEQQAEILERSEFYKAGKIKAYSLAEARKLLKVKESN